jgi:hypothetical protein
MGLGQGAKKRARLRVARLFRYLRPQAGAGLRKVVNT